jgi:murein tripeptide amidase MpaA
LKPHASNFPLKILKFQTNPSLFIESNIHAREWITSATATWIINEILRSEDRGALAKYNWYIFPVVNPDGFAYTKSTNRMWRKTRKPGNSICFGADPNRNWGYNFMRA